MSAVGWDAYMATEGDSIEFEVERARLQRGRTFSGAAMEALVQGVNLWIATRVMRRWEATNEPPSVVRVTVTVEAQ